MNQAWLKAAKQGDVAAMKALADYLEEQGDKLGAATWRSKAGLSRVVYQVVDTRTGVVEREYKARGPAQAWIRGYYNEEERHARTVRVTEFIERPILELKPDFKPAPAGRGSGKGPVRIIKGHLAGFSGEAIGFARRRSAPTLYQVVIDGEEYDMLGEYFEFLE